jgi:hypothetical protein
MIRLDCLTNIKFKTWLQLRLEIETAQDPFYITSKFFTRLPRVKRYTDPYDQSSWPTPWELIEENEYCEFNIILGICYTLQLTERFKSSNPKICLAIDKINKTSYYLLLFDDKVYGYDEEEWISMRALPKTLSIQKIYPMNPLH